MSGEPVTDTVLKRFDSPDEVREFEKGRGLRHWARVSPGLAVSKAASEIPEQQLEAYTRLVAGHPEIERKGATVPYTSVNGHMFSLLDKTGSMGLRLSRDEREAFLAKYETALFEQYGAVMKEYVSVPGALLDNTGELQPYLEASYVYVKSLKPKPTRKKG